MSLPSKRRMRLRLSASLLWFAAAVSVRAEITDNIGIDPKAMALGNAVTADPPGLASIHFNPAGLARIETNETDNIFTVASIRNNNHFDSAPDLDIGGFKNDPLNDTSSPGGRQRLTLPIVGLLNWHLPAVALPSLGFAYHQEGSPFTFATLSYMPFYYALDRTKNPNDPGAFDGRTVDIQRLVYVSPSFGYKYSDTLRFGVSVPITYASMNLNTNMRFPNVLLGTIGQLQKGFCPNGNSNVIDTFGFGLCGGGPQGQLDPFKKAANFNLSMSAPFDPTINLGVLWEPKDWFALGAVFQSGTSTTYHGTYQFNTDPMLRQFVGGLNNSLLGPIGAAILGLPQSIPAVQKGNVFSTVPYPNRFQFGLKVKPLDFVQLNLDVSYTDWAKWNHITLQFDQNVNVLEVAHLYGYADASKLTLPLGWRSVVNYGTGLQIQATSNLALRFGYEPRKSSVPANAISLLTPLPDTKLYGAGFEFKTDTGDALTVGASFMKGTYNVKARTDCNLNCDGFFNLIYNPYAATNVRGDFIVRYFGVKYSHTF
ncbi:long-subunit fatty acid transport protein [Oxalobacteraceae bacterium GrIS 2.11]